MPVQAALPYTRAVRTVRDRFGRAGAEPPTWTRPAGWVTAAAVAVAIGFVANNYWLSVATTVVTFGMLGIGLNVVVGYAGLLDLGYSAFFAIGAYVSALLELHLHFGFWETLPLAIAAAAVAGVIIGYPTLRLRSDYLAIVTLGFGEIVRIIATNLNITGGPNGLYGIATPSLFGHQLVSGRAFYLLGLAFLTVAIVYTALLSRSRLGRAWRSLREDETASEAVGVPTVRVKLLAYVMGAMLGGLAGPYFAARFGAVDPTSFTYQTSVQILIVVVLGGMGSIPGVLLGAIVVIGLPEVLRFISEYRLLLFALGLVVLMLVRPAGLWPVSYRARRPAERGEEVGPAEAAAAVAAAGPERTRGERLLTVTGLRRVFGGVTAVDGVDFTLHGGEILAIIGPNGAGKTTVFNCITGVTPPTKGGVELAGVGHLGRRPPHRVVKAGLARTFQGIRLFDALTVTDNVLVGMYVHRSSWLAVLRRRTTTPRHEEVRRAMHWLRFVGIEQYAGRRADELSYGDRRRLEIARALASDPRVLLLDEPAAGANPTEKRGLVELISRIRDLGVAVLLIEHDMALVMGLSDRVVVMDHGRVISEGTPEHVQADPLVIEAYLGSDEELDFENEAV